MIYKDESNEKCKSVVKKIKTLICAAVGTASHLLGSEACAMYDRYSRINSTESPVSGAGNVSLG